MADGSHKSIEEVKVGDRVLATDPETGETEAKPVIALITGKGVKNLVQVTVDTDGAKGEKTGVVIATDNHPFWVPELREWRTAGELQQGQWLRTSAGTRVQIDSVIRWTVADQRVHNLTVADLRTYLVALGSTDILVHNSNLCGWSKYADEFNKLTPGRQSHVRMVDSEGGLRTLFNKWTKGAAPLPGYEAYSKGGKSSHLKK